VHFSYLVLRKQPSHDDDLTSRTAAAHFPFFACLVGGMRCGQKPFTCCKIAGLFKKPHMLPKHEKS